MITALVKNFLTVNILLAAMESAPLTDFDSTYNDYATIVGVASRGLTVSPIGSHPTRLVTPVSLQALV